MGDQIQLSLKLGFEESEEGENITYKQWVTQGNRNSDSNKAKRWVSLENVKKHQFAKNLWWIVNIVLEHSS